MVAWGFPAISGLWAGIIAIVFGVVVMTFPRILNYLIGIFMLISGIGWLFGGSWLPGIVSILFGIIVLIFPTILNYLVGIYLILLGLWLWLGVPAMMIAGITTLAFGIIVMLVPAILNYIFGIYLIAAGVIAIGRFYGWF